MKLNYTSLCVKKYYYSFLSIIGKINFGKILRVVCPKKEVKCLKLAFQDRILMNDGEGSFTMSK